MPIQQVFPTLLYRDRLVGQAAARKLNHQILLEAEDIASLDQAGQSWSKKNYRNGYTSYASANELQRVSPTFRKLEQAIDKHVARFSRALDLDLDRPLRMTTCWINVMDENAHHGLHIHPLAVISGTYYVRSPAGASAIKFEDPRLPFTMHAPPKKKKCRPENQQFLQVPATEGTVVLFESWLRHEVPQHPAGQPRVSVSFNYDWE